jgi:hypothetical protein
MYPPGRETVVVDAWPSALAIEDETLDCQCIVFEGLFQNHARATESMGCDTDVCEYAV